ncbi:MAG TPA: GAF domain-containing protein [Propionibacteriaceae bacterium]
MARSNGLAMPPGTDPLQLTRLLHAAHDHFVSTGQLDDSLRTVVMESWRRSVNGGMNPETSLAPIRLDEARLAEIRATHPLASAMPVIRRLLVDSAAEAGLLVAVSDAAGQLLWVEGCANLRSRAEAMHFMPGADWSERSAGTNAPGTALALDAPVQILGPEHLSRSVTPWSCSAAPIHEPDTGAILGVLDITGGAEVATPQTLSLVRATVAAVEAELRLERLSPPERPRTTASQWAKPQLEVLGRRGARLSYGSTVTTLSLRHSEIMVVLAQSDLGLTAGELAVALSEDDHSPVTVRAELSRLRTILGSLRLSSRPYQVVGEMGTDLEAVRQHLTAGRLRRAVARYRGPVLPTSTAPAVESLRDELHMTIRSALLAGSDADALLAFADTGYGHDDYDIWQAAFDALPPTSPRYTQVAAHLDKLDAALA